MSNCNCTLCRKRAGLPVFPCQIEYSQPSTRPTYQQLKTALKKACGIARLLDSGKANERDNISELLSELEKMAE